MTHNYMLDTNVVSNVLRYPTGAAALRLRSCRKGELSISAIVAAELQFGAAKIGSSRLVAQLAQAATLYDVLPFDISAIQIYGELRAGLERAGTPIGPLDTLIAAHALALDLTLVTANVREFSRVSGLRLENWLG